MVKRLILFNSGIQDNQNLILTIGLIDHFINLNYFNKNADYEFFNLPCGLMT